MFLIPLIGLIGLIPEKAWAVGKEIKLFEKLDPVKRIKPIKTMVFTPSVPNL
jgi:hypothetical protein